MADNPRNSAENDASQEVRRTLGLSEGARWRRRLKPLLVLVALGVGGILGWQKLKSEPPGPVFRTVLAKRGDIERLVGATGSVEPIREVIVGAEISGRIVAVEAEWNERVHEGQVLARLDTEPLEIQLKQAEAHLKASIAAEKGLQTARRSAALAKETISLARESVEGQRARFEVGAATALEVIVAEQQQREAELRLARAQADEAVAHASLLHLTGRLLAEF